MIVSVLQKAPTARGRSITLQVTTIALVAIVNTQRTRCITRNALTSVHLYKILTGMVSPDGSLHRRLKRWHSRLREEVMQRRGRDDSVHCPPPCQGFRRNACSNVRTSKQPGLLLGVCGACPNRTGRMVALALLHGSPISGECACSSNHGQIFVVNMGGYVLLRSILGSIVIR